METTKQTTQNQPLDPLTVLFRAKRLGKKQAYFIGIFRRKQQHISAAFQGRAPGLLNKINTHLDILEKKAKEQTKEEISY